ncbi:ATP-binding cassette subfamily B protein [Albidovulum inexpectatum]|uniref:ATP-binding cassette subfamily B protein n=1 Tax=Albidovulum inexpectatum TaxID=196587 RepID=A0A2S5JJJ2_9RHOB|nr:ABC transporter ATP-binding protein [Albidovulum inexpectatum]PPB81613.1 ATP-binding cassette subfamily B protein [Albidovulum inexpectatum]
MAQSTSDSDNARGLARLIGTNLFRRLIADGIRSQAGTYGIAIAAMVVVALTSAATAWVMEGIVDAMTDTGNRARVWGVAGLVAVIFTIKGVASYVQAVAMKRAGNRIVARQQLRLYLKMLRQGVAFFDGTESSNLLMRVTNSAQAAREMINLFVTTGVKDVLTLIGLVAVMVYQQPLLSFVALIIGPIAMLILRRLLGKVRAMARAETTSLAEIIRIIQETSGGIRVIKVFGLEDRMIDEMRRAVAQVERRANSIARLEAIPSPLMEMLSGFAIAAVVLISSVDLGGEPTSAGQLMSFVTALLMAYEPAKRLSRIRIQAENLMTRVQLMFDILDQPDTMLEAPDAVELQPGPGEVRLDHVRFGYRDGRPVIPDLTLTFEPGKTTALVGPSGSGKSTVFNLVMRLYDPDAGAVLIDGQDLRRVTFASLRRRISFVGQDTFLFSTTIMENIRCARPEATDDEVIAAARAAHAHDFIMALPDGYQTQVGERGNFLSGGQRQRISIARTILRDAEILLLDEATSALDASSEAAIRDTLQEITQGRTTIVIAHRLSTILQADRIVVLNDGQIVEYGTAAELLERGGLFRQLYDQQFGGMILPDSGAGDDL